MNDRKRDSKGRWSAGYTGLPRSCRHGEHGLRQMRDTLRLIKDRGEDWISELGDVGATVREFVKSLIGDLGGDENVSVQQRVVIENVAKTWVMLQSVDSVLLHRAARGHERGAGKGLVNRRKNQLFPVVLERQRLADSLVKHLQVLGLEKRAKPIASLDAYLAKKPGRGSE